MEKKYLMSYFESLILSNFDLNHVLIFTYLSSNCKYLRIYFKDNQNVKLITSK